MLALMRKLTDPKTRESTAFYAALGVAVWDVITRGFHLWNALFMASLCGVGVAGALSLLMEKAKAKAEPEE